MKSVGERIRQARTANKMSGEALAVAVGYKNQSAIGNLENRAGGTGGNKIGQIADVLNVSVDWLLKGPDCNDVPLLRPRVYDEAPRQQPASVAEEPEHVIFPKHRRRGAWPFRTVNQDDYEDLLSEFEKGEVEGFVKGLLRNHPNRQETAAG